MNEITEASGSCLCGAISVTAETASTNVGVCHCSMCRKWGGGPYLAIDCQSDVSLTGAESLSVYDSSEWAERGFCAKCGTHLFYRLKEANQYIMPAGLLDIKEALTMDHQIFIDEKPDFYCFANETKNMTGAEVFEQFSGS